MLSTPQPSITKHLRPPTKAVAPPQILEKSDKTLPQHEVRHHKQGDESLHALKSAAKQPQEDLSEHAKQSLEPTQAPPTFEWRFKWVSNQKTDLNGMASWTWQLEGTRYTAQFEAQSAQGLLWRQASLGGFNAAGLAPERFTEERPKAGVRAINFQQPSKKVTFSGPSVTQALELGLQDPLSGWIQFISILRARTQPLKLGDKVAFQVVGLRADRTQWVFRFEGEEAVALGTEDRPTQHWIREPLPGFEGGLELWIDPKREFVPMRIYMHQTAHKQGFVFTWIEAGVTP